MVKGSVALRAAVLRLAQDELALHSGEQVATILWDVENFYDSMGLELLMGAAERLHFPLRMLAISIQVYLSPRYLRASGCYSLGTQPSASIVAGCSRANAMARIYLYHALDRAHTLYPDAAPKQFVDDLAQRASGTCKGLLRRLGSAAVHIVRGLRGLQCGVSSKSVIVASSPACGDALRNRILRETGLDLKSVSCGKDLGVASGAGRRRLGVLNARLKKAQVRGARVKRLARVDKKARKLYSTGLQPVAAYGAVATGLTHSKVEQLRTLAVDACGLPSGRCKTTALSLAFGEEGDPAVAMRTLILKDWIAFWRGASTSLRASLRHYWARMLPSWAKPYRWSRVRGPCGVVAATLFDVDWSPAAPDVWYPPQREGQEQQGWRISQDGPIADFVAALTATIMQPLWRKAASHRCGTGCQDGVDLTSFRRHLSHFSNKGHFDSYNLLCAAGAGALWPEQRKHEAGFRTCPTCPQCGLAPETEAHQLWGCHASSQCESDFLRERALASADVCSIFWLRGITPSAWTARPYIPVGLEKTLALCFV